LVLATSLFLLAGCASSAPRLRSCSVFSEADARRAFRLEVELAYPDLKFPLRLSVGALKGVGRVQAEVVGTELLLRWSGPGPAFKAYEERFGLERLRKTESRKRSVMLTPAGKVLRPL